MGRNGKNSVIQAEGQLQPDLFPGPSDLCPTGYFYLTQSFLSGMNNKLISKQINSNYHEKVNCFINRHHSLFTELR